MRELQPGFERRRESAMYWDGKVIDEYSTEEIEAILPEMRRYAIIMPGPDWVLSYHYAKDLLKERRGCLKP